MISFYPGPSRVYDEIPLYVADAARKGIMSINHRSEEFVAISQKTISLLKQKLKIPKGYTVFFTSSATECWEIIAQSWISEKSYHYYNGAFGEKWFDYTKRLQPPALGLIFKSEELLKPEVLDGKNSIICITQNETSNGTQVSNRIIKKIKKLNPHHLVAVDATSSMAGIYLDFSAADIWFASVQKCFGLPAGMGIMVCSPAAIKRVKEMNERNHYNSAAFMTDMMEKWQTPYTPNVLSIYLLMRVLEKMKPIKEVHAAIAKRYERWVVYFENHRTLKHLIKNKKVHSLTVIPVSASGEALQSIKASAKKKGFLLGEGYGALKHSTFRIANFPALKNQEIKKLKQFLSLH